MRNYVVLKNDRAQTAVEYMLLLGAVVGIVLVGLKLYLPRINETSNVYFNRAAYGIYGEPNRCGDGNIGRFETRENCCVDYKSC